MNRYAVLAEGFEHLSYPLSKKAAKEGERFVAQNETFVLLFAATASEAEMAVVASDSLSRHTSFPVGFVADSESGIFLVCRTKGRLGLAGADGNRLSPFEMPDAERICMGRAIIKRLAILHTEGFGCGGISPDSVEFAAGEARLMNPSRVFALSDADSPYYEAVATLRALYGASLVSKRELLGLAQEYFSHSPVCRHEIALHLQKKGKRATPKDALVDAARKIIPFF